MAAPRPRSGAYRSWRGWLSTVTQTPGASAWLTSSWSPSCTTWSPMEASTGGDAVSPEEDLEPTPVRKLPRPFSMHWGNGFITEEATYSGEYHEPTIQLLEYTEGPAA